MRLRIVIGILIAVAAVIGVVAFRGSIREAAVASSPEARPHSAPQSAPSASWSRPEGQAAPGFREAGVPPLAAVSPLPLAEGEERSPLGDGLHAPEGTPEQDIAAVLRLMDFYLERFGALPAAATNAQFVNALTGNNPRRVALIARSHPAINQDGELTDRWGTPFFFHLVAHDQIEIRSAGPDREMWSADDLLTASASLRRGPPGN